MVFGVKTKLLSVNKCWQGRRFKTEDYVSYEKEVFYLLPKPEKMMTGAIVVSLYFHLKNNKRADVDNLIKPLLDIMTKKGYWKDDSQIVELHAHKYGLPKSGSRGEGVAVEIKEIADKVY